MLQGEIVRRDDDNDSMRDDMDGRGSRDRRMGGRKPSFRKKVCKFCTQNLTPDYKNPDMLRRYITERGKILPARITGCCAKHQRAVTNEIKKARVLAYLPFEKK